MKLSCRNLVVLASCVSLSACDPSFETTSSQCSVASFNGTFIPLEGEADTPLSELFQVPAQTAPNEYRPYLEVFLEAIQPEEGTTLDPIEQESLNTFINFVNGEEFFNLGYEIVDGEVVSAANTADFFESIITSNDPDVQNGLFESVRALIAEAVERDDDTCSIDQSGALFVLEGSPAEDIALSLSRLSFSPSIDLVQQTISINQFNIDQETGMDFFSIPFLAGSVFDGNDYVSEGFVEPLARSFQVNTADRLTNLEFLENLTGAELNQFEIGSELLVPNSLTVSTTNSFCQDEVPVIDPETNEQLRDENGELVTQLTNVVCPEGTPTRVPQKSQCDGSDPNGIDETGMVQLRSIDLNGTQTGFKRLRIQHDTETNTVSIFGSTFQNAVVDSDGVTIIEDPTPCEENAIFEEFMRMTRPVIFLDENFEEFDRVDQNGTIVGENIPTPIIEYAGNPVPENLLTR